MRKIEGHEPGQDRCLIPEAFDNKLDDSPIKVWIKQPTLREKRTLLAASAAGTVKLDAGGNPVIGADGTPEVNVDIETSFGLYEKTIQKFVSRVENYEGPNGAITTASDLIEHGELDILLEAATAILGEDDDIKTKKHSDSMQVKTPALSGTAPSAEQVASRQSETVAQP
jgi:hypothetical protein